MPSYPNSVVVLDTYVDYSLVIRANPTDDAVRGFVEEHTRRYFNGLPCGPSGAPAYRIYSATRFATEAAFLAGDDPVSELDIEDLIAAP